MLRNCVTIKIHLWWQELKNLQTPSSMWTVITLRIRQSMSIREACFEKNGLLFGFCSNISYLCTDRYTDIQIYTVILKKLSCVRIRVYVRVRYFWKHLYVSVCVFSSKYYDITEKNIFYYQINTKFFYSISERILVYSVNKQKVKEQKTQHVETADSTRCLCKVNTLKSRTQHVVFAAGMNIFMSNLKSSTNWPAD